MKVTLICAIVMLLNASYMYHGIHGTLHVECVTYNNYVIDAIGSLNSCYMQYLLLHISTL